MKTIGAIIILASWLTQNTFYDNWNTKLLSLQTHRIIIEDALPHSIAFESSGLGLSADQYQTRGSIMLELGWEFNRDKVDILENENLLSHERQKKFKELFPWEDRRTHPWAEHLRSIRDLLIDEMKYVEKQKSKWQLIFIILYTFGTGLIVLSELWHQFLGKWWHRYRSRLYSIRRPDQSRKPDTSG